MTQPHMSDSRSAMLAWVNAKPGSLIRLVGLGVARVHRIHQPIEGQLGLDEQVLDRCGVNVAGLHQLTRAVVTVHSAHDDVRRIADRLPSTDGVQHGLDLRIEEVRRGEQQVDVRILRDRILQACTTRLGIPVGLDLDRLLEQLRMSVDHVVETGPPLDGVGDRQGRRP